MDDPSSILVVALGLHAHQLAAQYRDQRKRMIGRLGKCGLGMLKRLGMMPLIQRVVAQQEPLRDLQGPWRRRAHRQSRNDIAGTCLRIFPGRLDIGDGCGHIAG